MFIMPENRNLYFCFFCVSMCVKLSFIFLFIRKYISKVFFFFPNCFNWFWYAEEQDIQLSVQNSTTEQGVLGDENFFALNLEVSCVIKRESSTFIYPLLPVFAVTQFRMLPRTCSQCCFSHLIGQNIIPWPCPVRKKTGVLQQQQRLPAGSLKLGEA